MSRIQIGTSSRHRTQARLYSSKLIVDEPYDLLEKESETRKCNQSSFRYFCYQRILEITGTDLFRPPEIVYVAT